MKLHDEHEDTDDEIDDDDQVIAAQGENDTSESIKEAAKVIQRSPQALQVYNLWSYLFYLAWDSLVAVSADS